MDSLAPKQYLRWRWTWWSSRIDMKTRTTLCCVHEIMTRRSGDWRRWWMHGCSCFAVVAVVNWRQLLTVETAGHAMHECWSWFSSCLGTVSDERRDLLMKSREHLSWQQDDFVTLEACGRSTPPIHPASSTTRHHRVQWLNAIDLLDAIYSCMC